MMNGIDQDRFLPPPGLNTLLTEASGYCSVSGHTLIVATSLGSSLGDGALLPKHVSAVRRPTQQ